MMIRTRLLALTIILASATAASAVPIKDASSTTLPTIFDHSTGILSISGIRPLNITYIDETIATLLDTTFELEANLGSSSNFGGIAYGLFDSGSIVLKDSGGVDLLAGNLVSLEVMETVDGIGQLAAYGSFTVNEVAPSFEWELSAGSVVDMIFEVDPISFHDFATQSFEALSDITIKPIPEPLTLSLLGMGLAGMAAARRRRR